MGLLYKTLSWVRYVMTLGFPVLSKLPGVHRNIAIFYLGIVESGRFVDVIEKDKWFMV
jgi:hypothetical protein